MNIQTTIVLGIWTLIWVSVLALVVRGARAKLLSKRLFQVAVGVAGALFIACTLLVATSPAAPSFSGGVRNQTAMFMLLAALVPLLFVAASMAILFHRMWSAIQGADARTTPGRAVGFLFVPVFNLYWVFQAIWGWAKDYNAGAATLGSESPKMPEGFFLSYAILCVVAFAAGTAINLGLFALAPVLGLVVVVSYFVALTMIGFICDGVNARSAEDPTGAALKGG